MTIPSNGNTDLDFDISGSGPDLHLIAGASADRGFWAQIHPVLDSRFRTIAFDNRESGKSAIGSSGYGIGDLVEDARAISFFRSCRPAIRHDD